MTAQELFKSYLNVGMGDGWAKQCALIAVDEQIKLYNEMNQLGLLKDNSIGFELLEVKQEIEKEAGAATYDVHLGWENEHAQEAFIKGANWYREQLKNK